MLHTAVSSLAFPSPGVPDRVRPENDGALRAPTQLRVALTSFPPEKSQAFQYTDPSLRRRHPLHYGSPLRRTLTGPLRSAQPLTLRRLRAHYGSSHAEEAPSEGPSHGSPEEAPRGALYGSPWHYGSIPIKHLRGLSEGHSTSSPEEDRRPTSEGPLRGSEEAAPLRAPLYGLSLRRHPLRAHVRLQLNALRRHPLRAPLRLPPPRPP
ncbi:unnamed protein product [Arctogadus glacialis]